MIKTSLTDPSVLGRSLQWVYCNRSDLLLEVDPRRNYPSQTFVEVLDFPFLCWERKLLDMSYSSCFYNNFQSLHR